MKDNDAYNYLVKTKFEMADGMKGVSAREMSWGHQFEWDGSPILTNNISIILNSFEIEEKELMDWLGDDGLRYLGSVKELEFSNTNQLNDLVFYLLQNGKHRAPFLPNYTIRNFSFNNRNLRIDNRKMTRALSNMVTSKIETVKETERYIGGILHMLEGRIWTFENTNENILAGSLFSKIDDNDYFLEIFEQNEKFEGENHLKNLLESNLEFYNKSNIYTIAVDSSPNEKILKNLNFKEVGRLKLYQKGP